jgi:hypothetical protein
MTTRGEGPIGLGHQLLNPRALDGIGSAGNGGPIDGREGVAMRPGSRIAAVTLAAIAVLSTAGAAVADRHPDTFINELGAVAATPTATGSAAGATESPGITLPAGTDTIDPSRAPAPANWGLVLALMAGLLAIILVLTPRPGRRRR